MKQINESTIIAPRNAGTRDAIYNALLLSNARNHDLDRRISELEGVAELERIARGRHGSDFEELGKCQSLSRVTRGELRTAKVRIVELEKELSNTKYLAHAYRAKATKAKAASRAPDTLEGRRAAMATAKAAAMSGDGKAVTAF